MTPAWEGCAANTDREVPADGSNHRSDEPPWQLVWASTSSRPAALPTRVLLVLPGMFSAVPVPWPRRMMCSPYGADAHWREITEVTYVVCPASQAPSIRP